LIVAAQFRAVGWGTLAAAYLCMVATYAVIRQFYPVVARGWRAGLLALLFVGLGVLLLILGLIAICSGMRW
jgi:hypothetical protein